MKFPCMVGARPGFLPATVVRALGSCRDLTGSERSWYLKLWFLRALRILRDFERTVSPEIRSVLFVCHGNIIRSPMAAALLKQYLSTEGLQSVRIASAGLNARPNAGADLRAVKVARGFGIKLDDHHAQPLTLPLVEQSDVIFVMDYLNEARLLAHCPEARNKVYMLGACEKSTGSRQIEIPDPYTGDSDGIRLCYETLDSHIRHLACVLAPSLRVKLGATAGADASSIGTSKEESSVQGGSPN